MSDKYISKLQEKIEYKRGALKNSEKDKNVFKNLLKMGLIAGAYLGARTFLGPELDFEGQIQNLVGFADFGALTVFSFYGVLGCTGYLKSHFSIKRNKKKLKKVESKLEEKLNCPPSSSIHERGIAENELV